MPDETIVESCRVTTVSSCGLDLLEALEDVADVGGALCSSMSRTISPLARAAASATACLSSASSSPRVGAPGEVERLEGVRCDHRPAVDAAQASLRARPAAAAAPRACASATRPARG